MSDPRGSEFPLQSPWGKSSSRVIAQVTPSLCLQEVEHESEQWAAFKAFTRPYYDKTQKRPPRLLSSVIGTFCGRVCDFPSPGDSLVLLSTQAMGRAKSLSRPGLRTHFLIPISQVIAGQGKLRPGVRGMVETLEESREKVE